MTFAFHSSKFITIRYLAKLSILPLLMASDIAIAGVITDSVNYAKVSPTFLGLYINGTEQDSIDVLEVIQKPEDNAKSTTEYYINLDNLAELTNINYNKLEVGYEFYTPIGDAIIPKTDIYTHDIGIFKGKDFVSLSTLKNIGITAFFEQTSFAIHLNMGWKKDWKENSVNYSQTNNNINTQSLPIDYYPSRFGLLGLKINTHYSNNDIADRHSEHLNTTIGALGYGFGGAWGIHANTRNRLTNHNFNNSVNDQDLTIDNIYWTGSNDNWAARLGTNQSSISNNTFGDITGLSLAYSNRNINRHLSSFSSTTNSLLKNSTQDYQNITGTGMLGGVAELRINARPITRVQIGLDGRYEFNNLDVSRLALDSTIIEVAIFEYPLALEPIEVRTISLGSRRANVATDELLLEFGYGADGNIINQWQDNTKNKTDAYNSYASAEYGVANNLAIRGGFSHQYHKQTADKLDNLQNTKKHHQFAGMIGMNVVTSPYSNLDIEYQKGELSDDWRVNWQYEKSKFSADYTYTQNDIENNKQTKNKKTRTTNKHRQREHSLTMHYRPNEDTHYRLSQYYHYDNYHDRSDNDLAKHRFNNNRDSDRYNAIASISSRLSENFQTTATWQTQHDLYNYNLQWHDTYHPNTVSLSGNNDKDSMTLKHHLSANTSIRTQVNKWHGYSQLHWLGEVNHDFNNDNRINAGFSLFDGNFGWQTNWQFYKNKGIKFSLGYEKNYLPNYPSNYFITTNSSTNRLINNSQVKNELTPNDYLYAQLQLDFWKPPKRLPKLGIYYPTRKQGSILVDVAHPSQLNLEKDNILFKLDEQTVRSEIVQSSDTSSQFLIHNLKSGSYRIEMDGQNLPFEYDVTTLPTPRVQVADYASTYVPIRLNKTYAISGKLIDKKSGHALELWQDNQKLQTIESGSFGYFQILGLASGEYLLKAQGYKSQYININQDNVLGIKLIPNTHIN